MAMKSFSLPVSLIRQFVFCPRIPYFHELLGLRPNKPLWVKQGEAYHKRQDMLSKRRNLSRFGLDKGIQHHNLSLRDEALGIHGICDLLIETDEAVYPLEFKLYGEKPRRGQIYQLAAYGMLAEKEMSKPCHQGFILYGQKGNTQSIILDDKIREDVSAVIRNMQRILECQTMPDMV
jgi:CRISPR-associated exonuclease Cas4